MASLASVDMTATKPAKDGTYEIADAANPDHDKILAKKKAMMDARMRKRNDQRAQRDLDREKDRADREDPNSNTNKFWQNYKVLQNQVQDSINQINTVLEEHSNPSKAVTMKLEEKFPPLTKILDDMQKLAAGAAYYLPSYDSRTAAVTLRELRVLLAKTKEMVTPKKKFSFKEKRAAAKAAKAAKKAANLAKAQKEAEKTDASLTSSSLLTKVVATKKEEQKVPSYEVIDYIVSNKKNETITVSPGDLDKWSKEDKKDGDNDGANTNKSKSRDVVLNNLENCVVFLGDTMSALRVTCLKNCQVYGGPVAGSLLLEGCTDCTFWLASRQIRLHDAERCTFHLRVMSNPIIEDCTALTFSPYNVMYDGLKEMLISAGLGSTVKDMWCQVKDFKWHRSTHSPNWKECMDVNQWTLESKHDSVQLLDEQLILEDDTERDRSIDLNKGFEH